MGMTPQKRAEARRLVAGAESRPGDFIRAARFVVPLLDALEAAERERDEAQAIVNIVADKVIPTLHRLSREPRCGHHAEDALRALGVEP